MNGGNVQTAPCNGKDEQVFYYNEASLTIKSKHQDLVGLCLEMSASGQVYFAKCDGQTLQQWLVGRRQIASANYVAWDLNSDNLGRRCLTRSSTSDLVMTVCDDGSDQQHEHDLLPGVASHLVLAPGPVSCSLAHLPTLSKEDCVVEGLRAGGTLNNGMTGDAEEGTWERVPCGCSVYGPTKTIYYRTPDDVSSGSCNAYDKEYYGWEWRMLVCGVPGACL